MILVNTYRGNGAPTFHDWRDTHSRIDYLTIRSYDLHEVLKCEVWNYTGYHLQLAKVPVLRDHSPLVLTITHDFIQNPASSIRWDYNKFVNTPERFERRGSGHTPARAARLCSVAANCVSDCYHREILNVFSTISFYRTWMWFLICINSGVLYFALYSCINLCF